MSPPHSETSMDTSKTVKDLGEFQLIQRFLAPPTPLLPAGVVVGAGDDAAVLTVPRTQQLVVTTDTLLEGVHFFSDADPFLLGQKALLVNLSDMVAMAGRASWYLLSLSLPPSTPLSWVEAFVRGLDCAAQRPEESISRVGGNTCVARQGNISISITLLGLVGKGRALTRSGAQVGDLIFVSGTIGDACLGLAIQQGKLTVTNDEERAALQQSFHLPSPPIDLAIALQEAALCRSGIDISDGLLADLKHLCLASKVGAHINTEQVPLSQAAKNHLNHHGTEELSRLLSGGEDYQLLFTAAPTARSAILVLAHELGAHVTKIGIITAEPEIILSHYGQTITLETDGWSHF